MSAAPVLDSHALLALFRAEPGGEMVARILERAGQRDPEFKPLDKEIKINWLK